MLEEHKDKLIAFGLSEKEANVYLALLNAGKGTADQIAKMTKLNRSTTYVQIKTLMDMGMATTYKLGKKTYFSAESPTYIERLIDRRAATIEHQRSEAKQLLPELMKIFSSTGERPVVRIFEGKEGLVSMRNEMLELPLKEILFITSIDQLGELFTYEELYDFSMRREAKKIRSKAIYYRKEGESYTPYPYQELRRVRKEELPFGADVYIYGDQVSFASTAEAVVGVTISSPDIAESVRAMFLSLWEKLPE